MAALFRILVLVALCTALVEGTVRRRRSQVSHTDDDDIGTDPSTAAPVTTTTATTTTTVATTTTTLPPTTCAPVPPPPAPVCPCNRFRSLLYRTRIVERYTAAGRYAVNIGPACLDGGEINVGACFPASIPVSEYYNVAVQPWVGYDSLEGVSGLTLGTYSMMVRDTRSEGGVQYSPAFGESDPISINYAVLGQDTNGSLVCSDMFRDSNPENENAAFKDAYMNGMVEPLIDQFRHEYFVAQRQYINNGEFCACVSDMKAALASSNVAVRLNSPTNVISDWDAFLNSVVTSVGATC